MQDKQFTLYLDKAKIYREAGEFDKSNLILKEILDYNPGNPEALFWLVHQSELKVNLEYVIQLEEAYQNVAKIPVGQKAYVFYALAFVREKQGLWEESFNLYLMANKSRKSELNLLNTDSKIYIGQARFYKELYQPLARLPGLVLGSSLGKDLVFIVGLPRCGSTLVETILSMSNNTIPLGEIDALQNSLDETNIINLLQDKASSSNDIYKAFQDLDFIYRKIVPNDLHIKLDKTLNNFYLAGLLSRIWPAARIIHVQRHPMDQILSIWKARFLKGHNYSLELKELVNVYIAYNQLMSFWHEVLGDRIYLCQYEKLINYPLVETRKLAAYAGVVWKEEMLEHQKSNRVIKTASFMQARKPINDKSIGTWKNYKSFLQEFICQLRNANIEV